MSVAALALGPLLELGTTLIGRFFPDPAEKAKAELEWAKMVADGELKQVLLQLEINAKEAQHASIFVAGWRPFFGWTAAVGFAYAVILQPFLNWMCAIKGWPTLPDLGSELLWTVVTGLLGIGTLRTVEKTKGVTK